MKINKKISFFLLSTVILLTPFFIHGKEIKEMTAAVETAALAIGGSLVIIGWVIAGILYLTSIGSLEKMGTAKKALIAAIIGTILVVLAKGGYDMIKGLLPGLF
jgi:hypothetical protein